MGGGRVAMTMFTPIEAVAGGLLIGLAAVLLMATIGQVAGISGIVRGAAVSRGAERAWRLMFLAGLISAAALTFHVAGFEFPIRRSAATALIIVAGLLVGFGSGLGSGCTSGHGICGMARMSRRSMVATAVFMVSAIATTWIMRHGLAMLS